MIGANATAADIAHAVQAMTVSATTVIDACLARIHAHNGSLGAFTEITVERARAEAAAVDAASAARRALGPLAGVPYAVKNLFDIAGVTTLAGSRINRDHPPATADATLIRRLQRAGAILVGALNMGEYAYDFTGENAHVGPSRNPHDPTRMSGGSSGGSGSAVAAGLVPLSLGSDTNGSIRVPASLCGLFGYKPTFGRLSRAGTFGFCPSLDHVGPLARSVADLVLAADAMAGPDSADPVCQNAAAAASLTPALAAARTHGIDGLRIAVADDWFATDALPEAEAAVTRIAAALSTNRTVTIPEAERARSAAYVITNAESSALHLDRLRTRADAYDPDVRDRMLAGALLPAAWVVQAQRFRRWYQDQVRALFQEIDVVLAPATPVSAPQIGQKTMEIAGKTLPIRPNLGLFTQPISLIGLPVVTVPVFPAAEGLPIGVQIIAAAWNDTTALRVAAYLEANGVVAAPVPLRYQ